eukprot:TRINITY_DN2053_c0_g1_i2.p1 TRINITY_DN2053_c0_g1~~TRINITY_DN2053_c0_g1_i2.p1  ORF type:complete len:637 (-),score=155.68 TRINITY_DN2053_c0_g1_i2:20-1930(-)
MLKQCIVGMHQGVIYKCVVSLYLLIKKITSKSVILTSDEGKLSDWIPPEGSNISICAANMNQVLLACGNTLIYIGIEDMKLVEKKSLTLEYEISTLDITPIGDGNPTSSQVCTVGLWTENSVGIYTVPDFVEISKTILSEEIIPRSVLLVTMGSNTYLLVAMGDGNLFTFNYNIENGDLSHKKKIALASQSIVLKKFISGENKTNVFASSDRPAVVYCIDDKLVYSNVNLKGITSMCDFNTPSLGDSIVVTTEDSLTIGAIDEIQKLNISTIPLGEMPTKIHHDTESGMLVVSTQSETIGKIILVDTQSFDVLFNFDLEEEEEGLSITSMELDDQNYIVVGTGFINENEMEPERGRLLIFQFYQNSLVLKNETLINGSVNSIAEIRGYIICAVGSLIQLYSFTPNEIELLPSKFSINCQWITSLETRGNFVLVTDINSMHMLIFDEDVQSLECGANDITNNWNTSSAFLDSDNLIIGENSNNIVTMKRGEDLDMGNGTLEKTGHYHLGDLVNQIKPGSLVMKKLDGQGNLNPMLYTTTNGSIGVVATIDEELFELLLNVEKSMIKDVVSVGGFNHEEWRSFKNHRTTEPKEGFIDGDLIESLLELPKETIKRISDEVSVPVDDLQNLIEELSSSLH